MKDDQKIKFEEWIVGIVMVIMFAVTTVNVLGRYFFNMSLAFLDEATTYIFIFTIFFGSSVACIRGENLGMDSIIILLPKKFQKISIYYVTAISILLYIILFYQGALMTKQHFENKLVTASSGVPNWIFSIVIPISAVFYIIRCVQYAKISIDKLDTDMPENSKEISAQERSK